MKKYTKIVTFDVGTERPTNEYVEQLEEKRKHWWVLACQRFASMTKAREILGNIEDAPFKDTEGVDGAIQEAHDILDAQLRRSHEEARKRAEKEHLDD